MPITCADTHVYPRSRSHIQTTASFRCKHPHSQRGAVLQCNGASAFPNQYIGNECGTDSRTDSFQNPDRCAAHGLADKKTRRPLNSMSSQPCTVSQTRIQHESNSEQMACGRRHGQQSKMKKQQRAGDLWAASRSAIRNENNF